MTPSLSNGHPGSCAARCELAGSASRTPVINLTAKQCQSASVLLEQELFAQGKTPAARNVDHSMELRPLRFQGPFPLCSETADVLADCEFKNQPGIYLWVVRQLRAPTGLSTSGRLAASTNGARITSKKRYAEIIGFPNPDQRRYGIQTLIWRGFIATGYARQVTRVLARVRETGSLC